MAVVKLLVAFIPTLNDGVKHKLNNPSEETRSVGRGPVLRGNPSCSKETTEALIPSNSGLILHCILNPRMGYLQELRVKKLTEVACDSCCNPRGCLVFLKKLLQGLKECVLPAPRPSTLKKVKIRLHGVRAVQAELRGAGAIAV